MEQVLLKEEVIKFKKGLISRREIIPPLTNLILNSLKCYNIKNKEIIHDFYLLILSNLEKILNDYDEERFKEFESWFKKVIKRKFLNFITRENRIFTLALERTEYVEIEDLLDNNCKYGIDYITLFNNLNLSRLSDKEREILRLKLGFTSDKEVVDFITEKIQRIKEIEDTLSFKYVKLLKIHYDILKTVREEDKID